MSYQIEFKNRSGYLYVHISGQESYSDALRFWETLHEKSVIDNLRKFLIVDEVTGRLSTGEIFALSKKIAEMFSGKVVAYVDPKPETFDANSFGETVVLNRGVDVKVFHSEKTAINWINNK